MLPGMDYRLLAVKIIKRFTAPSFRLTDDLLSLNSLDPIDVKTFLQIYFTTELHGSCPRQMRLLRIYPV